MGLDNQPQKEDVGKKLKNNVIKIEENVLFPPDVSLEGNYIITDLRRRYDELSKVEEFKSLKDWELFFIWLIYCPCSPYGIEAHTENNRISFSLEWVFKKSDGTFKSFANQDLYQKYLNREWGEAVSSAINKMQSYDPSLRMKAASMINKIMLDYESIIRLPLPEDNDELKKRVDIISTISKDLKNLVKESEDSFGVRKIIRSKKEKNYDGNLVDKVYIRRQQKTNES